MEAPRRLLLALAMGGFAASGSLAHARRQEHRDPGGRSTALGRIWVLQSEGAGRALRLLRLFVDGRDVGSADTAGSFVHELPTGAHLVWTSEATAGHVSLLLRANESVVLRLENASAPSHGLRLVRMSADEGGAAIAAALQAQQHNCAGGGS